MRAAYLLVVPWSLSAVGGVSVAVRGIAEAMSRTGRLRPIVLILDWAHRLPVRLHGADVEQWSLRIPELFGQAGLLRQIFVCCFTFPLSLIRFARFLGRERVEVVNFHHPGLHCVGALLLRWTRLSRAHVVLSFHGADITCIRRERNAVRRWLWRIALERADALVACSQVLARELEQLPGVDARRVVVIANGVDVRTIRNCARGSVPAERPYVLCLATFEHKKGIDVLVKAFAELAERFGDVDLCVSGRSAAALDDVIRLVAALGLERRVRILTDTPHAEAIRLLSAAQVLVLPSRVEPFGLVVLEAAVLGVPVVFTTVCGVKEVLPADLVAVAPPDDPHALAAALEHVLAEPQAARRRAEELRSFVEQRLSWATAAAQYLELTNTPVERSPEQHA